MDVTPRPRGKRGPKPKGNRVSTTVALDVDVRAHAQAIAERDGLALCDVIGRLCAEALGLPVPPYCLPKTTNQEELPLAEAS
jgi:hypothetical protein